MATKKQPKKIDNVVIIDPATGDVTTESDTPTNTPNTMSDKATNIEEIEKNTAASWKNLKTALGIVDPGPGKRRTYDAEQKSTILTLIDAYNERNKVGGASFFAKGLEISPISLSQWRKSADGGVTASQSSSKKSTTKADKVDPYALYRVLKGRGFELSVVADVLDPSAKPEVKAGKDIQPLLDIMESGEVSLVQTSPKIKLEIDLDTMLSLLKIKARS